MVTSSMTTKVPFWRDDIPVKSMVMAKFNETRIRQKSGQRYVTGAEEHS
jgi:hypothetical protein